MGVFNWLLRLFGISGEDTNRSGREETARDVHRKKRRLVKLTASRRGIERAKRRSSRRANPAELVPSKPYKFARPGVCGGWLDLSQDEDAAKLEQFGLPRFRTPQELAAWLDVPLGRLAWLVHRFEEGNRPSSERKAHYHLRWLKKRTGGRRLIESPKPTLKAAQGKILEEILNSAPAHAAAHGFVIGRSIRTNAEPHAGRRVVVKFDLEEFYPSVKFSRVVAIFRSLGYSREAAIWLGRLTTTLLPFDAIGKNPHDPELRPYKHRHLPQGAPTSPALANLSAFSLDLRLAGLARTFGANYTRYADDLTFSGDERFLKSLAVFLPLVMQIIRQERFRVNRRKRKVIRNSQRQQVTGVVVNTGVNVPRPDYDRLKATLTNCIRRGPSTQNHERHEDFAAHLRGRIAHVAHLNPARGKKLLAIFEQINWNR